MVDANVSFQELCLSIEADQVHRRKTGTEGHLVASEMVASQGGSGTGREGEGRLCTAACS